MNDAHHADRMEHQRINRTNQLTFDLDKRTTRELGKKSWKFWRRESAITLSETGKPKHPHINPGGRREMRAMMESREKIQPMLFPHKLKAGEFYTRAQLKFFRQFTSEDHDNSTRPNRAQQRKERKTLISEQRKESRKKGSELKYVLDRRSPSAQPWRVNSGYPKPEMYEDIDRGVYGGP